VTDPEPRADADEFERVFKAMLDGMDRPRQLRGRFLDGMIELENVLDVLLCEILRVEDQRQDLVRATVLGGNTLRSKIDGLRELLAAEEIDDLGVPKRLQSLVDLRDMFAHAQITRPEPVSYADLGDLEYVRFRNGKVQRNRFSEAALTRRLQDISELWNLLGSLREALWQSRAGHVWEYGVAPGGFQWWDHRKMTPEDLARRLVVTRKHVCIDAARDVRGGVPGAL